VLTLRGEVGRHRRIQQEVLARFDRDRLNLVKECRACGTCYDNSVERCEKDGQELGVEVPVERVIEGKFRLERVIGRGGMGAVYEATDLRLSRRVAVKVMTGHLIGSGTALRRFAREAQASARLEHPKLVRVYDYGPLGEDSAYLVMEHVPGVTWAEEIERLGAFPLPLAAEALDQALEGVAAAHAAGILHRDLKPTNLMLRPSEDGGPIQVKILDFGLAKVRELAFADPKSLTAEGVTLGTFGYMAPEQLIGETVDERADVYSLGVIALEVLTGRLRIAQQFFHKTIDTELAARLVVPARTEQHRVLAAALRGCLAPARGDRTSSVREMRRVLIPAIRDCEGLPLPPPPPAPQWTEDSASRTRFRSFPSGEPTRPADPSRR
jgi:serine/threonine protein kinase